MAERLPTEIRRKQILDAAKIAFSKTGFHGTEVEKIAAEAGVGKGTVYRHFESKENLIHAVLESMLDDLIEGVIQKSSGIDDLTRKLEVVVTGYVGYFRENQSIFRLVFQEQLPLKEKSAMFFKKRLSVLIDHIENILREGQTEGLFKKLDYRITAYLLVGMMNITFFRWIMNGGKGDIDADCKSVFSLYLNGISID